MRRIGKLTLVLGLIFSVFCLQSCKKKHKRKNQKQKTASFKAIPMPSTLVSGQKFPTDSTVINDWVTNSVIVNNLETNENIITHGWDIWDALTSYTDEKSNNQILRRFETWYTPGDIKTAIMAKKANDTHRLVEVDRGHTGTLKIPHQHLHSGKDNLELKDANVVGFVKCDPSAAKHIYDHELYSFKVLKNMIKSDTITRIPAFPNSSVLIKPVFYPLTKIDSLGEDLYSLPVWPGYKNQVSMDYVIKNGFGPGEWNNDIKITLTGETDISKKVFSINDFIHFKLDKAQAKNVIDVIDPSSSTVVVREGDYAVLVGMHVNTRENKRWTWQTFWWSETPMTPNSPSSSLIASYKPSTLNKAAKHYAMALAYNMVSPSQPYSGGSNALEGEKLKESVYAFNPYLEAGFNAATFDASPSITNGNNSGGNDTIRKYYSKDYQKVGAYKISEKEYVGGKLNRVGIETNCMSCHGQARIYDVIDKDDAFQYYITDQYYDMNAPYFKSSVVLDFAWSIQGNLID